MRLSGVSKYFNTLKESSFIGKQKLIIYVNSSLIMIIGTIINLLGFMGPTSGIYTWMNSSILAVTIVLLAAFCYKRISLTTALSVFFTCTQLELIGEMISCAFEPDDYHLMLILSDLMLSTIVIMLTLLAYIRYLPCVLSILNMIAYTACTLITGDDSLKNFWGVVILAFFIICRMGSNLVGNLYLLEKENTNLKDDEAELLHILRLNKAEIKAYIELSKQKQLSHQRVTELLGIIGGRSQRNIIETVSTYLKQQNTEKNVMEQIFPELTESEREICSLILQGKKLGEICSILNKTETNINSQRAHIRKKLNLLPKDNLQKALEEKMQQHKKLV